MSAQADKSALPVGTVVRGYRLLDVLGSGGFGVTYMAEDSEGGERVAVKEYLPVQFAVREGTSVHPKSEASREDFEWGLDRFLSEAGMLTRFRHPNIVRVKGYFEANNTAYIVMEYEEGEPLDKLLDRRGKLTEAQLKRVLLPIADGLRQVHARGVWHRDVKPANIFVRRSDESPVLLDFGAARNALGARSASMTAIVSPPYAPPEQYDSRGELGAYTDIYALSALCWRAIMGEFPEEAPYRQRLASRGEDPIALLAETPLPGYSPALLHAVDWGLRLYGDERPQSVAEWLDAMGEGDGRVAPSAPSDPLPAEAMPRRTDRTPRAYPDGPSTPRPSESPSARAPSTAMGESAEPVAHSAPEDDLDRALPRFFRRLLGGRYGLAKTFWQFGVQGGGVFAFQEIVALALHFRELVSIYYFASFSVLGFFYLLLVAVGVWSAARNEGRGIGAILARLLALLALGLVMPLSFVLLNLPDLMPAPTPAAVVEPPAPAVESFTVENRSADDIVVVRAVPTTMANYGDNKLGTATVMPGRERRISLYGYEYGDACEFDVFIKTAEERTHQEQANLCQRNEIVFGDGGEQDEQDDPPGVGAESIKADPEPDVKPPPPPAARPAVGDRFRDCPACPEVVVVPAGSFRMGSPSGEQGRDAREGPAHDVTIASPFAIGVYEVTVSEFGQFVEETSYSAGNSCYTLEGEYEERTGRSWRNPGFAQDRRHPAACLSWDDAQAYVAWLSRKTGERYRVPSEAEWEYAARAGTTAARYWGEGEADQCRYANGADASADDEYGWEDSASCRDGHVKTSPVGSYAPNVWGLHDMLGNVHEWTADCWNSNYMGAPAGGSAWQDGDCTRRILRSGSWSSEPSRLRVADRRWPSYSAASRYDTFGLRVVRAVGSSRLGSGQPLTVRTGPPDARVQITNIGPRYQPGIKLQPDSYVVKVTARGFDTVERTLRHGDEPTDIWIGLPFRDCPVCPQMVEIPTGSYTMGTSRGDERFADEGPAHEVAIQSPIAVGVFEVSFDEWDACRDDGGCQRHIDDDGKGRGLHPVARATVGDAKEYANWLTVRTGRAYRLLSEAEWEYAARAGTSSARHWEGEEGQCAYANGADVTARGEYSDWTIANCTDGHVYAAPAPNPRFSPNPWGLHHMLGNVSEWTADCWHKNYVGAPRDGSPWTRNCETGHVARGGSWASVPRALRAPTRFEYDPAEGHLDVGFRVAAAITR